MKLAFTLSFLWLSMLAMASPPDTVLYRFDNGSPSVTASHWHNNTRKLTMLSPDSVVQYTLEEVRSSYRVSVDFKFHPNGAVKKAVQSTHPGGSRFWTESTIAFATDNRPIWMRTEQQPPSAEMLSAGDDNLRYWNCKTRQWSRQQTAECQPVPPDFR